MAGEILNNIITDGLIFYVDASNPMSYPGVTGISGNRWDNLAVSRTNGTIENATYNSAKLGSFGFNGSNSSIYGSDSSGILNLGANPTFTISTWINITSATLAAQNMYFCYGMSAANNTVQFGYGNSIGGNDIRIYYGLSVITIVCKLIEGWQEIALTVVDEVTAILYINGVSIGSNSPSMGAQTGNQWSIGAQRNTAGGTLWINANIASVKLYNRALTASEMEYNYNVIKNRFFNI